MDADGTSLYVSAANSFFFLSGMIGCLSIGADLFLVLLDPELGSALHGSGWDMVGPPFSKC